MNDFIHCTRHLSFDCRHCLISLNGEVRAMMTKLSKCSPSLHFTQFKFANNKNIYLCYLPKSSSCQGFFTIATDLDFSYAAAYIKFSVRMKSIDFALKCRFSVLCADFPCHAISLNFHTHCTLYNNAE